MERCKTINLYLQHCKQLRELASAVPSLVAEPDQSRRRAKLRKLLGSRERLLLEVGRMVRLGRLLRSRLREPLVDPFPAAPGTAPGSAPGTAPGSAPGTAPGATSAPLCAALAVSVPGVGAVGLPGTLQRLQIADPPPSHPPGHHASSINAPSHW